ncbi:MAG: hypothetical protein ACI8XU_000321 [Kiritimatiellia bacterium]|jgi:hypothetical protein
MNQRIESLLNSMTQLEDEIFKELKRSEQRFQYRFIQSIVQLKTAADPSLKTVSSKASYLARAINWRHIASIPFIYSMIIPFVFLDLTFTLYQAICFRLYQITPVKRAQHFIIDRQLLMNLNGVDKLNCMYCGYGNGVISYAREIASRTEQYWCPIKHAQKIQAESARYNQFLEYGDTEKYYEKVSAYRDKLRGQD